MSGYVYFVSAPDSGLIKIGRSQNPRARLSGLQTSSPEKLEFLGQIEAADAVAVEAGLHADFAHLRVRGEWFLSAPEILSLIEEIGDVMPWEMGEDDWREPKLPAESQHGGRKARIERYLLARSLAT